MAKNRIKQQICPNCDYEFDETDNFCPNCGQENHTHKLPVKHFVMEYLESAFHFDTKMVATLRDLLVHPGRITTNYNQNKRARYVPPMRLYIFISFIFFFLLAVLPEGPKTVSKPNKQEQSKVKINDWNFTSSHELVEDSVDSTDAVDKALSPYVGHRQNTQTKALFDSIRHTPEPDNELIDQYLAASKRDVTWYNRNFQRNLVKLNTGHFSSEEFMHKLQKTISTLMFFLMPLFALFLWLLFRRSRMYYTEHLVFSIHIHCIVFLVLTLYMLLSALFSVSLWWPFLITLVYGWLCARNVYGTGWIRTTSKVLSAGFFYSVSLLVVVIFGIVISFI